MTGLLRITLLVAVLLGDVGAWSLSDVWPSSAQNRLEKDASNAVRDLPPVSQTMNIMLVGRSGLGKTSCMNSLFMEDFAKKTSSTRKMEIHMLNKTINTDNGSKLKLDIAVIDTQGLGTDKDKDDVLVLQAETLSELRRRMELKLFTDWHKMQHSVQGDFPDPRVHVLLYFLPPHSFDNVDVMYMEKLSKWTLVVPVISKADCMTEGERKDMKKKLGEVVGRLEKHANGPARWGQANQPARVAAKHLLSPVGKETGFVVLCKKRKYLQGRAEVVWDPENEAHSDFPALSKFIVHEFARSPNDYEGMVDTLFEARRRERLLCFDWKWSNAFWVPFVTTAIVLHSAVHMYFLSAAHFRPDAPLPDVRVGAHFLLPPLSFAGAHFYANSAEPTLDTSMRHCGFGDHELYDWDQRYKAQKVDSMFSFDAVEGLFSAHGYSRQEVVAACTLLLVPLVLILMSPSNARAVLMIFAGSLVVCMVVGFIGDVFSFIDELDKVWKILIVFVWVYAALKIVAS